jgi:hypothetical protein
MSGKRVPPIDTRQMRSAARPAATQIRYSAMFRSAVVCASPSVDSMSCSVASLSSAVGSFFMRVQRLTRPLGTPRAGGIWPEPAGTPPALPLGWISSAPGRVA